MKLKVVEQIERLKFYEPQWKHLTGQGGLADNPFVCFDWVTKWWQCFGGDAQLHVVILECDNQVCGIGPFMINRKGRARTLRFIGYPQASYMDMLLDDQCCRSECVKRICEYIGNSDQWQLVNLHGFQADSKNYPLIIAYLRESKRAFFTTEVPAFFIKLGSQPIQEYVKDRGSLHNTFQNVKRYRKKLNGLGMVKYGPLDLENLSSIFALRAKRWEKKIDTSESVKPKGLRFFSELVMKPSTDFSTVVNVLHLNKRFLAFLYGFERNGRYHLYLIAHDDDFKCYGPGLMILEDKIKTAFEDGLQIFDFGIGYERYKKEWTDSVTQFYQVTFVGRAFPNRTYYIKSKLSGRIKELLKKYPKIVNFKRNTLGRFRFYTVKNWAMLKENLLEHGISGVLKHWAISSAVWMYQHDEYRVFELKNLYAPIIPETYQVGEADIEALEELARLSKTQPQTLVRRFYHNEKCIVVRINNQIACGAWLSFSKLKIPEWRYSSNLEKGEAGLYGYFSVFNVSNHSATDFALLSDFAAQLSKRQNCSRLLLALHFTVDLPDQFIGKLKRRIGCRRIMGYIRFRTDVFQ